MTTTAPAEPLALFPDGDPIERLRVYASRNSRAYHARRGCYAREDGGYFNAVDREINWGEVLVNNLEPCARCKPYDPRGGVAAVRVAPGTPRTREQHEEIGDRFTTVRSEEDARLALTAALGEDGTLPAECFEHMLEALALPLCFAVGRTYVSGVTAGTALTKQEVASKLGLGLLA